MSLTTIGIVSATAVGGLGLACAAPHIAACFILKTFRIVLRDDAFKVEAQRAVELARKADQEIASVFWSDLMRQGLQDAIIALLARQEFQEAAADLVAGVSSNSSLRDTIRSGVLEALQDEQFNEQIKEVFINQVNDEELQVNLTRAAISTVKTALREAVEDTELKEVITLAIRDALEDPRMREMLRQSLKEALADTELHRATFQGAVQALNPFKNLQMQREAQANQANATDTQVRQARSAVQSPQPGQRDNRRASSVEAGHRRERASTSANTSPNTPPLSNQERWNWRRM